MKTDESFPNFYYFKRHNQARSQFLGWVLYFFEMAHVSTWFSRITLQDNKVLQKSFCYLVLIWFGITRLIFG